MIQQVNKSGALWACGYKILLLAVNHLQYPGTGAGTGFHILYQWASYILSISKTFHAIQVRIWYDKTPRVMAMATVGLGWAPVESWRGGGGHPSALFTVSSYRGSEKCWGGPNRLSAALEAIT